jgi:hypothetical protein
MMHPPVGKEGHLMKSRKTMSERFPRAKSQFGGFADSLSLRESLLLFRRREALARRGSTGLDYSFDKRVFRQVFVVLSYNCLGFL